MSVNQNDVLEISARMEFNGVDDVVNTFQYQYLDTPVLSDAVVANDIIVLLEALYALLIAAQNVLVAYKDVRIANQTQGVLLGVYPWLSLIAGTGTADPTAPGVAVLANFSTLVPRVVMRKFFGIFTEANHESDGTWTAALTAAVLGACTPLLNPQLAVVGTYQFGYFSPKTAQFEAPTSVTVTDVPSYQRRRRQGRGS